jgi:hypothetical protein
MRPESWRCPPGSIIVFVCRCVLYTNVGPRHNTIQHPNTGPVLWVFHSIVDRIFTWGFRSFVASIRFCIFTFHDLTLSLIFICLVRVPWPSERFTISLIFICLVRECFTHITLSLIVYLVVSCSRDIFVERRKMKFEGNRRRIMLKDLVWEENVPRHFRVDIPVTLEEWVYKWSTCDRSRPVLSPLTSNLKKKDERLWRVPDWGLGALVVCFVSLLGNCQVSEDH